MRRAWFPALCMLAFAGLALVGCGPALLAGPARPKPVVIRTQGLVIDVRESPGRKMLPEYWPFRILVRNTTKSAKTLHARVVLSSGDRAPRRVVARCVVYRELAPLAKSAAVLQCHSNEAYSHWKLEVLRVWPFIPGD